MAEFLVRFVFETIVPGVLELIARAGHRADTDIRAWLVPVARAAVVIRLTMRRF